MRIKIAAVFASAMLIVWLLAGAAPSAIAQGMPGQPQFLQIPGVGAEAHSGIGGLGIFDASIADNTPPGQRLWMSYSTVTRTPRSSVKTHWLVALRLAFSENGGATWRDAGAAEDAVEFGSGAGASSWNSEVSSLVHDPWAPPAEQWKLFWHKYLMANGVPRFAPDSWIAYKAAATPEGLRSAPEAKLFGGKGYDAANNTQNGTTASPVGGPPLIAIWQRDRNLACIAMTEPGAMATPAGIYLAMNCIEFSLIHMGPVSKIVLLKCAAPCRVTSATAWRYVATLFTQDSAKEFGFEKFSAADLFMEGGRAYILATPVSNRPVRDAYNGCFVFRFANLDQGTLEAEGGRPAIVGKVEGAPNSFNGACTYQAAETGGGVLINQLLLQGGSPTFELLETHQRP